MQSIGVVDCGNAGFGIPLDRLVPTLLHADGIISLDCCVNATRCADLAAVLCDTLVFRTRDVQDDGKRQKSDLSSGVNVVMYELIGRHAAKIGVMRDVAEKVLESILNLVRSQTAGTAGSLIVRLQAAVALAAAARGQPSVLTGIDGIMGVSTRLIGTGLGAGRARRVTRKEIALGRKGSGKDIVCQIVGSIPGRQFL